MELIKNLIEHKLIKPGSWLGVSSNEKTPILSRLRVQKVNKDKIWACVPTQNKLVEVEFSHIQEVDGMRLQRFCAQADLDNKGVKLQHQIKRGRKPKNPRNPSL